MVGLSTVRDLQLDGLTHADVPAAAALSSAIGWNQDEADWRRLVTLHPEGAVAARLGGRLVGTATLVSYPEAGTGFQPRPPGSDAASSGSLSWLGMVISDPTLRGQGIGSAVTDAVLARWEAHRGAEPGAVIGLDATEFGAPLYRRRGFETVATIERWTGELQRSTGKGATEIVVGRLEASDLIAVTALDQAVTGIDRSALLQHLASEPTASLVVAKNTAAEVAGYAVLRSGRTCRHIGPLVAAREDAVVPLLDSLVAAAAGSPVFLDVVSGVLGANSLAAQGLSVTRTLQRMTKPAVPVFTGTPVVVAMGFAWG